MKAKILNEVFAEFCETQTHLDSLLSRVNPSQKSKVAELLGAFLRRPWSIAAHFKIQLDDTHSDFWSQNFIRLKKNPGIHATLTQMWERWEEIPSEGDYRDFPSRMVADWEQDWGSELAAGLCRLLSQDPLTTLRFHRRAFEEKGKLKTDVEAWLKSPSLPKSRIGNWIDRARVFRGYASVQRNEFYHQGFFEIQDEGSQVMSAFTLFPEVAGEVLADTPITAKRGQKPISLPDLPDAIRVVDACAGAGGKTLALSDLMGGRGRVFAYDIYDKKIKALKLRLERAQESNIQARLISKEEASFFEPFRETADVVLVDSPCTGFGVMRRNPDIKWNRKPLELHKRVGDRPIFELQGSILSGYSTLVKPGGRVVYGVCTFNREETTTTVERFLESHPDFRLEKMGFVGPYDTDGFFMASMVRSPRSK